MDIPDTRRDVTEPQRCPRCEYTWDVLGLHEHGNWNPYNEDDLICPDCGRDLMEEDEMTVKYKAECYGSTPTITKVEIERETEKSIWRCGRKHAKFGRYENYFDTWDEAYDFLRKEAIKEVKQVQGWLANRQRELCNVKMLINPEATS